MARKADKVAYANKAELIGNPEDGMRIEVVEPHDGLERGCQYLKPAALARHMIKLGYWKEVVKIEEK